MLEKVAKVYEENKKARRKAGLADAVDSGAEEEGSDSDSSEEEGSDSGSGGSGSSGSEEDGSEVRTRPHPPLSLSSSALIVRSKDSHAERSRACALPFCVPFRDQTEL